MWRRAWNEDCLFPLVRHLDSQLAELEKMIERMMEADFVHFTLEDVRNRVTRTRGISSSPDGVDSEVSGVFLTRGKLDLQWK